MKFQKAKILSIIIAALLLFTGCNKEKIYDVEPLLGLDWFDQKEEIDNNLTSLSFADKREKDNILLYDYNDAELFEVPVSVTFCFENDKLIGINYHDTKSGKSYIGWLRCLEDHYGLSSENSTESASWFENPIGENTYLYLYQLDGYVQISFYATEDIPDKEYERISTDQTTHTY